MWWYHDEPFEPVPSPVLFIRSPLKFTISYIYAALVTLRPGIKPTNPSIKLVCISDSHSKTKHIPGGDVLIHAGDLTDDGTIPDIQAQVDWLHSLPHKYKLCIAGNHDSWLDPRSRKYLDDPLLDGSIDWKSVKYLQHSTAILHFPELAARSLIVYGAPQIPACGGPNFAFQYERGNDAWSNTVPSDTDVLVTHTPPIFHRDLSTGRGCEYLLKEVWRVKPIVHICGHVHAGRGREQLYWDNVQRVYERACARADGLLRSSLNPLLWLDLVMILAHGSASLIWSLLWGGKDSASTLINASLTYRNTGRLENAASVVWV